MDRESKRHNNLVDALEHTFSVYSNELLNAIYIDLHTDDSKAFYIVYNIKGQVIKEDYDLSRRNTLSLNPFPSGLYTIEINDRAHKVVKKVLKF
ncbi:T9SS type A sorting domain-containing protein [uncultured Aquimarina sp.]|uniref:T9SS type A sorting domain-containing protein n=1 Tax=uncultured Aquimarina sp. TaxID=575652 RepID=UPI00261B8C81|nr:T9SS type A sorting domain-containing protein [uncultured Aquimarina sp.]